VNREELSRSTVVYYEAPMIPALKTPAERIELDELTLRRAKHGDRAAFGVLVRFYQRPVFALLSRMLYARGRRDLVEDLAQETFVRALRAISTFGDDGRDRLSSWLLTIAARVALDALKRRALPEEPLDELVDIVPGPRRADEALMQHTLRDALLGAIEELPLGYRAVFLLREVHDMEYEEIAVALEIDLGTVKSRLSRARAALRKALSETAP
jgi:RNA polymerase sigma-70 factor, ECF subfamily